MNRLHSNANNTNNTNNTGTNTNALTVETGHGGRSVGTHVANQQSHIRYYCYLSLILIAVVEIVL